MDMNWLLNGYLIIMNYLFKMKKYIIIIVVLLLSSCVSEKKQANKYWYYQEIAKENKLNK